MKASVSLMDFVIVKTEFGDSYIAQIVGIKDRFINCLEVKIMACIYYPSQKALLYKDAIKERYPLEFGFIHKCSLNSIELYYGTIPEYYDIMARVLEETFLIETEADREIFERHKRHWIGKG